jgi:hypothetical protein
LLAKNRDELVKHFSYRHIFISSHLISAQLAAAEAAVSNPAGSLPGRWTQAKSPTRNDGMAAIVLVHLHLRSSQCHHLGLRTNNQIQPSNAVIDSAHCAPLGLLQLIGTWYHGITVISQGLFYFL